MLAERGARAIALKADFIQRPDYQALLTDVERQLGPVNILVNNAAFATLKGVLEQSAEEWDEVIETNLTACMLLAKYAARSMIARGDGGKIINVGSIAGSFGTGAFPSYAISKAAMQGLTRCLAVELAPHKIQVNSLVPGWFATDMTEWIRTGPEYAAALKTMIDRTPRGPLRRGGGNYWWGAIPGFIGVRPYDRCGVGDRRWVLGSAIEFTTCQAARDVSREPRFPRRDARRPRARTASQARPTPGLSRSWQVAADVSRETSLAVFLFYFSDDFDRVGEEFHPLGSFWFRRSQLRKANCSASLTDLFRCR